jgi:uncharacterized protein YjiS (DUF1127 family)
MSQIDQTMQQLGRRRMPAAPLSSIATLAAPARDALAAPAFGPWLVRSWRALHAGLGHATDMIATWRERARMRRHLLMLDDRLLRDIGVNRLQARSEAEKPFWRV